MAIIDFGSLEGPVKQVEAMLKPYNQPEQDLIIRTIVERFQAKLAKQKQKEYTNHALHRMMPKEARDMLGFKDNEDAD